MIQFDYFWVLFFLYFFPVHISAPKFIILAHPSTWLQTRGSSGYHPDRVRIQVRPDQNQSSGLVWVWTEKHHSITVNHGKYIWIIPHPLVKYKIVYPVYCNIFKYNLWFLLYQFGTEIHGPVTWPRSLKMVFWSKNCKFWPKWCQIWRSL